MKAISHMPAPVVRKEAGAPGDFAGLNGAEEVLALAK
jgi:hypothetical protein